MTTSILLALTLVTQMVNDHCTVLHSNLRKREVCQARVESCLRGLIISDESSSSPGAKAKVEACWEKDGASK